MNFIDQINNIPTDEYWIWNRLYINGFQVFLVGGAVRDIILGKTPEDYDFATNARPDDIRRVFEGSGLKVKYIDADSFGKFDVGGIDVATFRGDFYGGNGDKDVEIKYVDTIEEDLSRRDFTVNAMALDINGNLVDPFNGVEDARNSLLRFVGDANKRIWEDPNRILRGFRFAASHDFDLAPGVLSSVIRNINRLELVKPERIQLEIMKTMKNAKDASYFWSLCCVSGALNYFFPELKDSWEHDHGKWHQENVWDHLMIAGDSVSCKYPLIKLAAYLHDVGKPSTFDKRNGTFFSHQNRGGDIVRNRLKELKFSNEEVEKVSNLVDIHMDGTHNMTAKAKRKLLNKLNSYGLDWREFLRMRIADRNGNVKRKKFTSSHIRDYVKRFTEDDPIPFSVNQLALRGKNIIEIFSLTPSPIVGIIQKAMFDHVVEEGSEVNNTESLVEFVKKTFPNEVCK